MQPEVTEEWLVAQTREAQVVIRDLQSQVHALTCQAAALQTQMEEIQSQLKKLTPQNSSLPPSSQHPRGRPPKPNRKSKKKRGGHLKRDFQALIDHQDPLVKRLGYDLMRSVKLMFQHWKSYKSGKIKWETFRAYMRPIRQEVDAYLLRGAFSGNRRLRGMCNELYQHREWLWTFVGVTGRLLN